MITLIGANGSMGQRYQAILKFLKIEAKYFDKEHSLNDIIKSSHETKATIIATPTNTHAEYLRQLLPHAPKLLCEKPVIKDIEELDDIVAYALRGGFQFHMMAQYMELLREVGEGPSSYDYFRHGPDGLIWDCLQIVGLSKGEVDLREESPVWKCTINGQRLSLADMDYAYVSFVGKWLNGTLDQPMTKIIDMHKKTSELAQQGIVEYESAY